MIVTKDTTTSCGSLGTLSPIVGNGPALVGIQAKVLVLVAGWQVGRTIRSMRTGHVGTAITTARTVLAIISRCHRVAAMALMERTKEAARADTWIATRIPELTIKVVAKIDMLGRVACHCDIGWLVAAVAGYHYQGLCFLQCFQLDGQLLQALEYEFILDDGGTCRCLQSLLQFCSCLLELFHLGEKGCNFSFVGGIGSSSSRFFFVLLLVHRNEARTVRLT